MTMPCGGCFRISRSLAGLGSGKSVRASTAKGKQDAWRAFGNRGHGYQSNSKLINPYPERLWRRFSRELQVKVDLTTNISANQRRLPRTRCKPTAGQRTSVSVTAVTN